MAIIILIFVILVIGWIIFDGDTANKNESSQLSKEQFNDSGQVVASVEQVRWNNTRDGQYQCWLKLNIDGTTVDMSKYIYKKNRGIIQQFEAIEAGNIIRVDYQKRGKYFNIKTVRKLRS